MGHIDPDDIDEDGGAVEGSPHPDDKASTRAPGSLMSVKIRKRLPGAQSSAGPAAPGENAPAPKAPAQMAPEDGATDANTPKELAPTPAADRISRITQRAQSERAARPAAAQQRPAVRSRIDRVAAYQPPPAPVSTASDDEGEATETVQTRDIVAYWTRLRGGRRYPKSSEIDTATIGEYWPNSILIRCRPGSRALEPQKQFMAGDGTSGGLSGLRGGGRVNLSPMMLQWLLGLAGEVVLEGRPMNDVETFPSVNRVVHYRAVALPFSDNESAVDHVLCHVNSDA